MLIRLVEFIEFCICDSLKMINFASLFTNFRGGANSAINDLIDQSDITLDRLLDEDSFVN